MFGSILTYGLIIDYIKTLKLLLFVSSEKVWSINYPIKFFVISHCCGKQIVIVRIDLKKKILLIENLISHKKSLNWAQNKIYFKASFFMHKKILHKNLTYIWKMFLNPHSIRSFFFEYFTRKGK